jgi:hypothetical protein
MHPRNVRSGTGWYLFLENLEDLPLLPYLLQPMLLSALNHNQSCPLEEIPVLYIRVIRKVMPCRAGVSPLI